MTKHGRNLSVCVCRQWHRNQDNNLVTADAVYIVRNPALCPNKANTWPIVTTGLVPTAESAPAPAGDTIATLLSPVLLCSYDSGCWEAYLNLFCSCHSCLSIYCCWGVYLRLYCMCSGCGCVNGFREAYLHLYCACSSCDSMTVAAGKRICTCTARVVAVFVWMDGCWEGCQCDLVWQITQMNVSCGRACSCILQMLLHELHKYSSACHAWTCMCYSSTVQQGS